MQQLQVAETQLAALTDELHAAQDQSRQQQLQMVQTQAQADATLKLKDRQVAFQQQSTEAELKQLEDSHQTIVVDTQARANHAFQQQEQEKHQLQQQFQDALDLQNHEREINTQRWKQFESAREQDMITMENRQHILMDNAKAQIQQLIDEGENAYRTQSSSSQTLIEANSQQANTIREQRQQLLKQQKRMQLYEEEIKERQRAGKLDEVNIDLLQPATTHTRETSSSAAAEIAERQPDPTGTPMDFLLEM